MAQTIKNLPTMQRPGFNLWVGKSLWRREWQPTPVFLSGESHGWRSLAGYSLVYRVARVGHDFATKPPPTWDTGQCLETFLTVTPMGV